MICDWFTGDLKSRMSDSAWIKNEAPPKTSHQKEQPLTYAEQDRQKILLEMRRKTQLLNDNSWIRQRSASVQNKAPVTNYGFMRRYESHQSSKCSSWSWGKKNHHYCVSNLRCSIMWSLTLMEHIFELECNHHLPRGFNCNLLWVHIPFLSVKPDFL